MDITGLYRKLYWIELSPYLHFMKDWKIYFMKSIESCTAHNVSWNYCHFCCQNNHLNYVRLPHVDSFHIFIVCFSSPRLHKQQPRWLLYLSLSSTHMRGKCFCKNISNLFSIVCNFHTNFIFNSFNHSRHVVFIFNLEGF